MRIVLVWLLSLLLAFQGGAGAATLVHPCAPGSASSMVSDAQPLDERAGAAATDVCHDEPGQAGVLCQPDLSCATAIAALPGPAAASGLPPAMGGGQPLTAAPQIASADLAGIWRPPISLR